jgi:DNA-binding transcriptional ArsR family regulator
MKVIDLTSKTQALHVRVDPSPVYDMLAGLFVAENWTSERGFEVDRRWVQQARAALGADLRPDLRLFVRERGFIWGTTWLLEDRSGVTISEWLKLLAALPPASLVERMLTAPRAARAAAPLLREALRTRKEAALREFLAGFPADYDQARVREIVTSPPGEIQHRLLRLFRTFYGKVYQAGEAHVANLLRTDAESKTAMLAVFPPEDVIERATGGLAFSPDAEIARVVLAPSYFFRPYNIISEYPGVRLFVYPVALGPGEGTSPTHELSRLYKALGDETRLRILQMLAEREMYLQEIANRLGVTHVTTIHHLAQLRAAQLVRVVDRGNLKYYQLRREAVQQAGARLAEFVSVQRGGR